VLCAATSFHPYDGIPVGNGSFELQTPEKKEARKKRCEFFAGPQTTQIKIPNEPSSAWAFRKTTMANFILAISSHATCVMQEHLITLTKTPRSRRNKRKMS
jgi:hypothetical protein